MWMPQGEKDACYALKARLGLYDLDKFYCHDLTELWFTWDNFHKGLEWILKRLESNVI